MSEIKDKSLQSSDDEADEIIVEKDIISLGIYLERTGFFKDKPWIHAYTIFLQMICITSQFCFEYILYDESTSRSYEF